MKKIKVGIVGCGAIGSEIAKSCLGPFKKHVELSALYDIDEAQTKAISRLAGRDIKVGSLNALFGKSDLIVEAANGDVGREVVKKAILKSKAALIMSVGGLIEHEDLLEKAKNKGVRLFFPSGAVCGIDGLKSAKMSKIEKVTLKTRKPTHALAGAPYIKEKNIDLDSIKGERVIFKGDALSAVRGFPQNINVASILSLAGIGAKNTVIEIIADSSGQKNTHEVEITGDFGRITAKTENVPFEKNPKTSKLAALSAIATLEGIIESVRMGT